MVSNVKFKVRPTSGPTDKTILEKGTFPNKPVTVWDEGEKFWCKPLIVLRFDDPVPVIDRVEVHTTNDESFGIDPVFSILMDDGARGDDRTLVTQSWSRASGREAVTIIYCTEGDRRFPK